MHRKLLKSFPTKNKQPYGFSLVELLVVVAILAILAAIAIPLFLNQRSKAVHGSVQSDARNFATDVTNLFSGLSPGAVPPPSLTATSLTVNGETMNFTASPNVSFVSTTAPVSLNGYGVKVSSSDDLTYACVISMPFTVQQGWENGFQPQCGTIVSEQGNLLTANQASIETNTAGLRGEGASIVRSTSEKWQGLASLRAELPSTGPSNGGGTLRGTGGISITSGSTYTASAAVLNGAGSRNWRIVINWWASDGSYIATPTIGTPIPASGWTITQVSGTAPANAAFASVEVVAATSGSAGDAVFMDALGLWQGSSGLWSLPGVPIVQP